MNFVYFDFFAETDICVFTRLVLGDGLIGWEVVSDEETTKKKKKKNARKKIQIVTVISKRKVRH